MTRRPRAAAALVAVLILVGSVRTVQENIWSTSSGAPADRAKSDTSLAAQNVTPTPTPSPSPTPTLPPVKRITQRPFTLRGNLDGAPYEIRVPKKWNGTLVIYAHGLRNALPDGGRHNTPAEAFLSDSAEKELLARGYALAGSAYRTDGWAVDEGTTDLRRLATYFEALVSKPRTTLLAGFSMGSVIALSEAERNDLYDGVLGGCPIGAGTPRTFDAMLDLALAYDAIWGWPAAWGTPGDLRDDLNFPKEVLPVLLQRLAEPGGPARFELMRTLAGIPKGPEWPERVWGFATTTRAQLEQRAGGPFVQNLDHTYGLTGIDQLRLRQLGLPQLEIDLVMSRIARDRISAGPGRSYVERFGTFQGDLNRPVLLLGTRADALVPPSHVRAYELQVSAKGDSKFLMDAWTNGLGHCNFNPRQLATAITALENWVKTGQRPGPLPAKFGFFERTPAPWPQP
ncbi:hypothetical protein OG394_15450 [Kribbella sp. NBC_01245]|uniref:hypothetical protein n=1 Tax=Kribbella sp. NBC_01245 TaxID=2903578 RepID=UPI002E2A1C1A|nr:hypothetical protein [Kribbella sp. NBC_01245]